MVSAGSYVCCIIVNWNGWKDTIACLTALKALGDNRLDPVVVDNGSTDGSMEKIRAAHPDVTVLQSGANLGFAGGNNVGLRYGLKSDRNYGYFWLLNNDAAPMENALRPMVAKLEATPKAGACGSVCHDYEDPAIIQNWAGGRYSTRSCNGGGTLTPMPDDWFNALNGASMLVRRTVLEQVGLLDEGFFLYWEDIEFGMRIRKAGWLLVGTPDSHVRHRLNASSNKVKPLLERYFTTSALRIRRLHSTAPGLANFRFMALRLGKRLLTGRFSAIAAVLRGWREYRASLPIVQKIH